MLEWKDIIVFNDELDASTILNRYWSRLLNNRPAIPLILTCFGDWFYTDDSGNVFFLDLLEGASKRIAGSRHELEKLLTDQNNIDNWFLPGFIESLNSQGLQRSKGKLYAYKIHPIFGGELSVNNLNSSRFERKCNHFPFVL